MINQDSISIIERLLAPTPKLFRIIQIAGVIVGAVCAAVAKLDEGGVNIPAIIVSAASFASAAIAQLTVDYRAQQENKLDGKL